MEKSMKRKIDSLVEKKKINKFGKIQEKLTKIKTEKKQVTNPQMKQRLPLQILETLKR